MAIRGLDGVMLDDVWKDRPSAYMSVGVPGFPNFFMINGPNSPVGNFSLIRTAEMQFEYLMKLVDHVAAAERTHLVPSADAAERFETERVEAAKHTVWATGCRSWYLDDRGIPFLWPFPFTRFTDEMEKPRFEDHTHTNTESNVTEIRRSNARSSGHDNHAPRDHRGPERGRRRTHRDRSRRGLFDRLGRLSRLRAQERAHLDLPRQQSKAQDPLVPGQRGVEVRHAPYRSASKTLRGRRSDGRPISPTVVSRIHTRGPLKGLIEDKRESLVRFADRAISRSR